MNQKSDERETFQFFKFHAITPFTDGNILAAYYNQNIAFPELPKRPSTPQISFAQTWKDNGYILGTASDMCGISNLPRNDVWRDYVKNIPFDHEGNTLACDPTYHDEENYYSVFHGYCSFRRRCGYGKDMNNYVLEYGDKFWKTYPTEKKLLWLDFLDAHEGTQEVITYLDEPLFNFFNNLERENLLEDTSILFWSDHGFHYDVFPINYQEYNFRAERALPFLFLVLPHKLAVDYRQNLKENQQKLVSAWQLHHFLMAYPVGKASPHLQQSILEKLPMLTCNDFEIAYVLNHTCYCNYTQTHQAEDNDKFRFLL